MNQNTPSQIPADPSGIPRKSDIIGHPITPPSHHHHHPPSTILAALQSRLFLSARSHTRTLSLQHPVSRLRSTQPQPYPRHPFSTSPASRASEAPRSPFEAPYSEASVPLYDRLQQHPQALAAIENFAKLCKEKTGVNLSGGDKPSMALMYSLSSDPELRKAAEVLMKALTDAGIKIDPAQAFQALKTMGGEEFDSVGGLEDLSNDPSLMIKKGRGNGDGGEGEGEGKK